MAVENGIPSCLLARKGKWKAISQGTESKETTANLAMRSASYRALLPYAVHLNKEREFFSTVVK